MFKRCKYRVFEKFAFVKVTATLEFQRKAIRKKLKQYDKT